MARKWIFGNQQNQAADTTDKPVPVPINSSADAKKFGLENFGNTCYANSVIQALYFCGPFRDLILQSEDPSVPSVDPPPIPPTSPVSQLPPPPPALTPVRRKPERKASVSGALPSETQLSNGSQPSVVFSIPNSPPTLFSALRSLFLHISTNPAEKGTVAPRAFIDKLRELNDMFRSSMHQDAHEFLNFLLNKMNDEMEEDRRAKASPCAEDLSNSIGTLPSKVATISTSGSSPEAATLIHKLFEGVLTSETRCLTCETVSSRDELFLDLSIDIEENTSVTACLRQFSASEMLCQKNKFFCDSCCDLQEAEKRMKIKKLPNVLALHLKRFKFQEEQNKFIKLAYRVAFPFQLRLFNTVDDTEDADRLYDLFAIVVHIGNGPHHGHYISIVKTLGAWLVFDDDNVYPIAEADIPKYFGDSNSGSAYVLYYQAVDIDLAALGLRPVPAAGASPSVPVPVLPPGLEPVGSSRGEEELSDSTAPSESPLLPEKDRLKIVPPPLPLDVLDSSAADQLPVPVTPGASSTKSSVKGIFSGIRRTPSTNVRPSTSSAAEAGSRKASDNKAPPPLTSAGLTPATSENGHTPLTPNGSALPPSPHVNGKEKKEKTKEPERKASTWFGKRKSLRSSTGISPSSEQPQESPVQDESHHHRQQWFRSSGHHGHEKTRRPSEPALFDAGGFATLSPSRPKSTAGLSAANAVNGYESSSASATSSVGSVPQSQHPQRGGVVDPPPRNSSLQNAGKRSPEHKKSLSSLVHKDKKRNSGTAPRPATATGGGVNTDLDSRPLPPVPPLPDSIRTSIHLEDNKGKMRADEMTNSPTSAASSYATYGLASFSGTNTSTSTTTTTTTATTATNSTASSNLKRATRKLSLTAPMLSLAGFGKKDKEKKDGGKGPPSAFPSSKT